MKPLQQGRMYVGDSLDRECSSLPAYHTSLDYPVIPQYRSWEGLSSVDNRRYNGASFWGGWETRLDD